MLKITIIDTPTEERIVLAGKLLGPWIKELQKTWDGARLRLGNRKLILDLNDVVHIEEEANSLLIEMLKEGTELVATGLLNQWVIQALKDGKHHVSARAVTSHKSGIAHSIDVERKEVVTVAEGAVKVAEIRAHLMREQKDSALPYRELIDARRAVLDLSPAEVREVVELLRVFSLEHPLGPTAVVVSTPVAYGAMRMLQTLVEDVCVIFPFQSLAQAETWLRGRQD